MATLDGVSAGAFDAALGGVSYDPEVKRHDGGVAMFGHNFAGFAASHVTPGWSRGARRNSSGTPSRSPKIEQRFGVPGPVLVAIWGQETSFGGDNGSFPTYTALATLAYDCRRAERYRAELIDALMLVERGIVQHPSNCAAPGRARSARRSSCPPLISCLRRRPTGQERRTSSMMAPTLLPRPLIS